ncbi:MAG TPA: hypothetical protein VJ953_08210 [Saprospiraceae bacterium]|nr:hypothetical protein [Saprospiraceae bacterium]
MRYYFLLGLLFLLGACRQNEPNADLLEQATQAMINHQGTAPFDLAMAYSDIKENGAYIIQKKVYFTQHPSNDLAGYKAALTSPNSQALLQTDHPAAGYLPKSGWVPDGDTILAAAYTLPFIEVELGYYLKETIRTSVPDLPSLQALVASVYPVIELPDIGFDSIQQVKLTSFIAHNAAAKQFITGTATPLNQAPDLNTLTCQMYKDGQLLGEAKGADALGNQWEALRFLINQRVEMGEEIRPNDVLITGSLGRLYPFATGSYRATYGPLGELTFVIQ